MRAGSPEGFGTVGAQYAAPTRASSCTKKMSSPPALGPARSLSVLPAMKKLATGAQGNFGEGVVFRGAEVLDAAPQTLGGKAREEEVGGCKGRPP